MTRIQHNNIYRLTYYISLEVNGKYFSKRYKVLNIQQHLNFRIRICVCVYVYTALRNVFMSFIYTQTRMPPKVNSSFTELLTIYHYKISTYKTGFYYHSYGTTYYNNLQIFYKVPKFKGGEVLNPFFQLFFHFVCVLGGGVAFICIYVCIYKYVCGTCIYIRKMLCRQQNNNKVFNMSMIAEFKIHRTLKHFMQEGNSEIIQVFSFYCQGKQDSKKPDNLYNIHSLPVVEMKGKLLSSDFWYNSHINRLQIHKEAVLDSRYPFQQLSS